MIRQVRRGTYAIGNNARASLLAGIKVTRTTIFLYMLSGFFSSLGMLLGFGGQASLGIGDLTSSNRSTPG
jgi:ribose/xylose/arabinose/galactoside ABC-type transport system permease subunit